MMSRRNFLNGATATFAAVGLIAGRGFAHEDHTNLAIDVNVIKARRLEGGVALSLELASREQDDVTLYGLHTQGLEAVADMPLTLVAGASQRLQATLIGAAPALFSLQLDFGPRGSGPVLVMLEAE